MANLTLEQRRGLVPPRVVEDAATRKRKAQPAPVRPAGGPHPLNTIGGQPVPPATGDPGTLGRGLRIGFQGQGEMIGDMLGAPGDIARLGRDAINAGGRDLSNAAFGEAGGAAFRDQLGKTPAGRVATNVGDLLAEALPTAEHLQTGFGDTLRSFGLGGAIIPEAEMTNAERIGKAVNRFGTGAAIGGTGALRAAGSKLGETLAGKLLLARQRRALRKGKAGRQFTLATGAGTVGGAGKETKDLRREGRIADPDPENQSPFAQAIHDAAAEVRAAEEEGGTLEALDAWQRAMRRLLGLGQ